MGASTALRGAGLGAVAAGAAGAGAMAGRGGGGAAGGAGAGRLAGGGVRGPVDWAASAAAENNEKIRNCRRKCLSELKRLGKLRLPARKRSAQLLGLQK